MLEVQKCEDVDKGCLSDILKIQCVRISYYVTLGESVRYRKGEES